MPSPEYYSRAARIIGLAGTRDIPVVALPPTRSSQPKPPPDLNTTIDMKVGGPVWKVIALLAVITGATGWICFYLATAPEDDGCCGGHEETTAETNSIHSEHQH